MRIHLAGVFVDDRRAALDFYTRVLGFEVRHDIPLAQFHVDDVQAEHERLRGWAPPSPSRPPRWANVTMAVFDDTCGNLIQIVDTR